MAEIGLVLEEISHALRHLRSWARPRRVPTPLAHFPARSWIQKEPYGLVLIMSPWNYPFLLSLAPLVGAVAAGNCGLVKPSAYSQHTTALLEELFPSYFDPAYLALLPGGREVNQRLLDQEFDYIFFTGSPQVGRLAMGKAAENLTPITLELGGKSPTIVDETARIDLAARRIVWGKFLNAGQTCIAPDYVLVDRQVEEELLEGMVKYIGAFYGDQPLANPDYPRIINQGHQDRLLDLIDQDQVYHGGAYDREGLKIEPTLLAGVEWEDRIMEDEIFGPILPVIGYKDLEEELLRLARRPKPLALYLFTEDRQREREVLDRLSFGGGCVNDTIVHIASSHLPFGGVGESGLGSYHGKRSFDCFSHEKSILKKSSWLDLPVRYPPYGERALALVRRLMK